MITATARQFGYPKTLVHESTDWVILLRPAQATLGALVLAYKGQADSLADVPALAFATLPDLCKKLERALRDVFGADKFNYLALMMVDKDVHFHVLPRYENSPSLNGKSYGDECWPGPPDVTRAHDLTDQDFNHLLKTLRQRM
ncbi:HIT family protein [Planktotalea arctica]|uniref:HIT family protein n=1 Tax=Planktotalea arctica TaxID=1481893 RepID=UPI00321C270B